MEGAVGVGVAEIFDVFGEVAEEEDVVGGDFAGYFDLWAGGRVSGWVFGGGGGGRRKEAYVCAIAGSDDETAVEDEFHVACSAGFGAGGGDVLADVGGWNDDFGFADIVVFNVDDLEKITNVFVVVDDFANTAD